MAETPTGILSKPLDHLRTLLSNSSNFQTWVSAANAAAALSSIYVEALDRPTDKDWTQLRPFAAVWVPRPYQWTVLRDSERGFAFPTGTLMLHLENDITPANIGNYDDETYEFLNDIGGIIEDIRDLSGTEVSSVPQLMVQKIEVDDGPLRSDDEEQETMGTFMQILFRITWGHTR